MLIEPTTSAPDPVGSGADVASHHSPVSRWSLGHAAVIVVISSCAVILAGPLMDIDLYWHLLIGREILDTGRLGGLGTAWSSYAPGTDWITTQWLSELVLTVVHDAASWRGIVVLRLVLGVSLLVLVAWVLLLRRTRPWPTALLLLLVAPVLVSTAQERPNLATLLLTVWLSARAAGALLDGRVPRWWEVLAVTALWANLHGGWVLVPLGFGLLAAAGALDRTRRSLVRPALILVLAGLVGACLTPFGVRTLVLPLSFTGRTSHIAEWQRTEAFDLWTMGLLLVLGLLVVAWSRRGPRPSVADLVVVGGWAAFGMLAIRNVAPATLMILPIAAASIDRLLPRRGGPPVDRGLVITAVITAATAGVAMTLWVLATTDPLTDTQPRRIAAAIAADAGSASPARVLNEYDASGVLAYFGGPGVILAVDGRADRFEPSWIDTMLEVQRGERDPWPVLDDLDATHVVTEDGCALQRLLEQDGRWRTVLVDGDYALLVPSSTSDSTAA